jgi:hypothetical protein
MTDHQRLSVMGQEHCQAVLLLFCAGGRCIILASRSTENPKGITQEALRSRKDQMSTNSNNLNEEHQPSLVERLFDDPRDISQGEYTAIYDILLNEGVRNNPVLIVACLEEFSGWAQYMLEIVKTFRAPEPTNSSCRLK